MIRALVLGGGACLWRDLQALSEIMDGRWPHMVVAVNDAGWAYRFPIDHWVTLHGEKYPVWREMRRQLGYPMDYRVWGGTWVTGSDDSKFTWIDEVLPVTRVGSTGLHAVDVALFKGAERIITVGIPMDGSGHFFDPTPWDSAMAHRDAWIESAEAFSDTVRSMSGWTADLLGSPDRAWIGL